MSRVPFLHFGRMVVAKAMGNVLRSIRSRIDAMILVSATSFWPLAAGAAATTAPLGNVSLPSNLKSGTVIKRVSLTPMQVCGADVCRATRFLIWPGGNTSELINGPDNPTNVSGITARVLIDGKAQGRYDDNLAYRLTIDNPIEVEFVADNRTPKDGTFAYPHFGVITRENNYIYLGGGVKRINGSCSVPAQNVLLPDAPLGKFGGVGSTAGTKTFQVRIDNCPKGFNQISYKLIPVGGVIADSPGVLPLETGSTVKGASIRITDNQGAPAAFDTAMKVDGYDKATGGSYSIPMQVSYIKTDATITPGTVKGSLNVVLEYQ
jgi:type 1 fimbria pilin